MIIRSCLEGLTLDRRQHWLWLRLSGADALSAGLAEGRLLSPVMVAASGREEGLRPTLAWTLWAAAIVGTLAIAVLVGEIIQGGKPIVPKPPEVLAERARDILAGVGQNEIRKDSEFWFEPEPDATAGASTGRARFVYRESPSYLVPQNLFRVMTETDPAPVVPGMASAVLDPTGGCSGSYRPKANRGPAAPRRSADSASRIECREPWPSRPNACSSRTIVNTHG